MFNLPHTQLMYHRDPSYIDLRVFGCLCYPLFPSTTINKFQPRSTLNVFLGYPLNHRGYKCSDLSHRKIIISRHVIFNETQFPFAHMSSTHALTYDSSIDALHPFIIHQWTHLSLKSPPNNLFRNSHIPDHHHISPVSPTTHFSSYSNHLDTSPPPTPQTHLAPLTQTMATRSMRGIYKHMKLFNMFVTIDDPTISPLPKNHKLSLAHPNWKSVMRSEFNAIIRNITWDLVH